MKTTFKTTTQDFSHLRALTAAGKVTGFELIDMNESDYAACQKGKQELAALCTPATVIALLDALDALQAEVKHLNLHLKATQNGRDAALARLAELQDEIGQMMADALNALYQPPAPDCRTCEYMWIDVDLEKATSKESCARSGGAVCINGSLHKPAPKVVLWRQNEQK